MGQEVTKISEDCTCCAPGGEEPEMGIQVNRPVDPSSSVYASMPAHKQAPAQQKSSAAPEDAYRAVASAWGSPEEEEGFFVPPPTTSEPDIFGQATKTPASSESKKPDSGSSKKAPVVISTGPQMPSSAEASAPAAARAPAPAPSAPAPKKPAPAEKKKPPAPTSTAASSSAAPSRASGDEAFEAMLRDLLGAEEAAYGAAFRSLGGGEKTLNPDHEQLRNFVLIHSGIGDQDLDTELLKIASARDDFAIDAASFIMMLREHPIADAQALNLFMNVTSNGETITAEECRTCLVQLMHELPDAGLNEVRLEKLFDSVMVTAGLSISMEEWLGIAKTACRTIRLLALQK